MDTKWVLTSTTMWGAFITGLTASLPSVNTFLQYFTGYSIEPDWVAALNEGVKSIIMGVGALVGLAMVIYGRFTADKPLTVLPK